MITLSLNSKPSAGRKVYRILFNSGTNCLRISRMTTNTMSKFRRNSRILRTKWKVWVKSKANSTASTRVHQKQQRKWNFNNSRRI